MDSPDAAVASADQLIQSVMADRGYPVKDFDTRAADISVDHPDVAENYRQGHRLARKSANGNGSTEDLRQAMRHYRALFDDLVEPAGDEPIARAREDEAAAAEELGRARPQYAHEMTDGAGGVNAAHVTGAPPDARLYVPSPR